MKHFPSLSLALTFALSLAACNSVVLLPDKTPPTVRPDFARMDTGKGATFTVDVLANDTAGTGHTLVAGSLDLDPSVAGLQTSRSLPEGTFVVQEGKVVFTSETDAATVLTLPYSVQNTAGLAGTSSVTLTLVKPENPADQPLFSFEAGTEGWRPLNDGTGTVETTPEFHTHGAQGLRIRSTKGEGDWFGVVRDVSFEGKTLLKFDLKTHSSGTSYNLALQIGPAWTWCQGSDWTWVDAGKTVTASIDLSKVTCGGEAPDLKAVHGINLFFNQGEFDLDHFVLQ